MSTEKLIDGFEHTGVRKISVDAETGAYGVNGEFAPLSVVTVNYNTYMDNIQGTDKELSDAIYLMETDTVNALNRRVVNVGLPSDSTDATNKEYADALMNQMVRSYVTEETFHDQAGPLISSSVEFGRFMTYLPESFILKSVTLQCHSTTEMRAGTYLNILDFDNNLLLTSKPLPHTCTNAAYATFEFEDNNVVLHNHQIYWVRYIPNIAAKVGNANVTSTDGSHTFISYYVGGSFPRQIFVYKIEFYTP